MVIEEQYLFLNREQAAHQLAERLERYATENTLNAGLWFVPYEKMQSPTDKTRTIGVVSPDHCVVRG